MFPFHNFKSLTIICAIILSYLFVPCSFSEVGISDLRAVPDEITFHDLNQGIAVKILYKNQHIKKADIKRWSFLAGKSQYNHMISVKVQDDKIIVAPALLEVGTYDLIFETTYGKCLVSVYAPLDKLSDTLENRAKQEGITVDELKKRLGLVVPVHKSKIYLELPSTYYEGQTVEIHLEKNPDLMYVWRVNSQVIKQGEGETSFVYTFPKPGDYTIEIEERDGDIVLGKASATTKVIAYDPIPHKVRINQPLQLSSPEGYSSYIWKIDGIEQKENKNTITLKFNAEKKYIVECIAKGPKDGNPQSFFRTTYEVTVIK